MDIFDRLAPAAILFAVFGWLLLIGWGTYQGALSLLEWWRNLP
jgi:hypothetical protein